MSKIPTHVAVCGDSFAVGHGLDPEIQFEKSFGGLIADHYNLPHLVYGRSGCCNFVIYLQVKKIVEQIKKDKDFRPFVLLSDTWVDRIVFPIRKFWFSKEPNLSDVDYLNYEPYNEQYPVRRSLPFKTNRKYKFVSEGLITFLNDKAHGLEQLFNKSKKENVKLLTAFFDEVYDYELKKETDKCMLASAHLLLIQHNIPHLFLTQERNSLVNNKNNMLSNWEKLIKKYPDLRGTGHCNEIGHKITAENVIKHIDNYCLMS